jgi:hypothetical protein
MHRPRLPALFALVAAALSLAWPAAHADPGYYVVTPYDNAGLRIVDFRYWTVQAKGRGEVVWPEVGLGYGINSRWTSELFVSLEGSQAEAVKPATLNWQNEVLLTQGQWPLDVALHLQFIKDRDTPHAYTLEFGPVLQTDLGRTQLNANLFFDKTNRTAVAAVAKLKYQWQLRYRWTPPLHVGLQGFGELGVWNHWSPQEKQSHRAGPALFGTLRLEDRAAVKLQAAYLLGKTYGQRGHMFTLRAHSEF